MAFLKRFIFPVVFLAAFVVTIGSLQAHKLLLQKARKPDIKQVVDLLQHGDLEALAQRIDSHYWDTENNDKNQRVLNAYKERLANMGAFKKRHAPVFSVRSASIPEHKHLNSDVYIVHADYERGEFIYTFGIREKDPSLNANPNAKNDSAWEVDRLTIDAVNPNANEDQTDKVEYKLSLLCSETKGITKKCRKAGKS